MLWPTFWLDRIGNVTRATWVDGTGLVLGDVPVVCEVVLMFCVLRLRVVDKIDDAAGAACQLGCSRSGRVDGSGLGCNSFHPVCATVD